MSLTKIFEESFDEVLKFGTYTRDVKIGKNLVIKLTPVTEEQLLSAKLAVPQKAKTDVLTFESAESFEIIARAVVAVNDVSVIDAAKEELAGTKEKVAPEDLALITVRKYLGKLPPKVLNYLSREYNELVREQYKSIKGKLGDDIENF